MFFCLKTTHPEVSAGGATRQFCEICLNSVDKRENLCGFCQVCVSLKIILREESIFNSKQLMKEVSSALRPHHVGVCDEFAVGAVESPCAALGISASGILGVEHVLSRLSVLYASLAEQAVELGARHGELLGYLRGGEARDGVEHVVGIRGAWLELCYLSSQSVEGSAHHLHGACHERLLRVVRTGHHISSLLAYGGQHLGGHPVLESARALELRTHDERVEAALVDEGHQLFFACCRGALF